jgi:hypothetical protein
LALPFIFEGKARSLPLEWNHYRTSITAVKSVIVKETGLNLKLAVLRLLK